MTNLTKHLVIVGDGTVGKTCLLYAFTNKGGFKDDYMPTIYDKEQVQLHLDNAEHTLKLHDTAGQEEYERIRQVIYKEASVFILCFSLDSRTSFNNIKSKWYPELRSYQVPIVLVGTKSDLKNASTSTISLNEADRIRSEINANNYLECSAKAYDNINEVIYAAVRAVGQGIPEQEVEEDVGCFSSILNLFNC